MRKRNLTLLALLLILALLVGGLATGCPRPRRMPAPSTPTPTPTPTPTTPAPTAPAAPTTIRDLAADVTNFVRTIGIPGVNRAETIVVGNIALVGIDLRGAAPGAPGTTTAPGTPTTPATPAPAVPGAPTTPGDIERTVADRVLATYPQLVDVKVTSDPTLSGRIIAIVSDMRAGRAATDHITEIANLTRRIPSTPTRRVTPYPPPGPTAPAGPVGAPTPVR